MDTLKRKPQEIKKMPFLFLESRFFQKLRVKKLVNPFILTKAYFYNQIAVAVAVKIISCQIPALYLPLSKIQTLAIPDLAAKFLTSA